jgi:hypothetical protein
LNAQPGSGWWLRGAASWAGICSVSIRGSCRNLQNGFGDMSNGNSFGGDAQYGKIISSSFPDLTSQFFTNPCT